jgi:hypothetical protein
MARWNPNSPTPVLRTPSRTSLETMAENATLVGATNVAWADSQIRRQPIPTVDVLAPTLSPPVSTNPSPPHRSPAADATRDHTQHGGAHPGHLDPSQRGGALPDDPYPPYFASGSRAWNNDNSARYGGAARANCNQPYRRASSAKPVVRKATVLTHVTFLQCPFSFNGTSRMAKQLRIP